MKTFLVCKMAPLAHAHNENGGSFLVSNLSQLLCHQTCLLGPPIAHQKTKVHGPKKWTFLFLFPSCYTIIQRSFSKVHQSSHKSQFRTKLCYLHMFSIERLLKKRSKKRRLRTRRNQARFSVNWALLTQYFGLIRYIVDLLHTLLPNSRTVSIKRT